MEDDTTQFCVSYCDEHGTHSIQSDSIDTIAEMLADAGYEGPRLKVYAGETLRGYVGPGAYTWVPA